MKLLLFILLNAASIIAIGQSRGYAGYIRMGSMSVPDARDVFPKVMPGITGFTSNFTGIGGELEYRSNRTVVDAELMILSHGPVNSGDSYAEPFTGGAVLKAGYVALQTRNFLMYPNAGAGFGAVVVNTYQKSGDVKNKLHSIYLLQPVLDFGLNSNVIVYRFKNQTPTGILPVGVRAGYRLSFASHDWRRTNGVDLSQADYSMRGWYLSVALGMGYITSNEK
jgi:hypothetical protein